MRIIGLFLLMNIFNAAIAQQGNWDVDTGRVVLNMPVEVKALLERHQAYLEKVNGVPGFRIQITATAKLSDIQKVKEDFKEAFSGPEVDEEDKRDFTSYIVYNNPNYRLQVGNYRTRLAAYRDLVEIRKLFPQAFIYRGPIDIMTK